MTRRAFFPVALLVAGSLAGVMRASPQQPGMPAQLGVPGVAAKGEGGPALYERPRIETAPGLTATVVVPPGEMYDPTSIIARPDGSVWISDDGGVAGMRGGYIWQVDRRGRLSTLVDASRMRPATGFDVAPKTFGRFGGQIVTLSTPTSARIATRQNHVIDVVSPRGHALSTTLCTLPDYGDVNAGLAGGGVEAKFGPEGSPFANRFFSVLHWNATIYQTTADGTCKPFVHFDAAPFSIAFTNDGAKMLVARRPTRTGAPRPPNAKGVILSVAPDGIVDKTPVFADADPSIMDIEVAPRDFPRFAGEIFYTQWGPNISAGADGPPQWDGALYRITKQGRAELVASGFSNPQGIAFSRGSIWITDINRDGPFLNFKWVADGFLVRIDVPPER
jgi:hypothetical protein